MYDGKSQLLSLIKNRIYVLRIIQNSTLLYIYQNVLSHSLLIEKDNSKFNNLDNRKREIKG